MVNFPTGVSTEVGRSGGVAAGGAGAGAGGAGVTGGGVVDAAPSSARAAAGDAQSPARAQEIIEA